MPPPPGLPASCGDEGVLCDKLAAAEATILTYTGWRQHGLVI
jgi:hypothetical protein